MAAIRKVKNEQNIEDSLSDFRPKKRYLKHKFEKKVTVKHYLNKKITVNKTDKKSIENGLFFDEPVFPVYVQITFNRKTTTIKSSTNKYFTENEYERSLKNFNIQDLFDRERNFIEFHFQNRYKSYLDFISKQFKHSREHSLNLFHSFEDEYNNFIEKVQDDFDINRFIKEYSYSSHEIHRYIDSELYEEIIEFKKEIDLQDLKRNKGKSKTEFQYSEITLENINQLPLESINWGGVRVSALELLSFLEMRDSRFSELRKRHPSEIWHFTIYYRLLKNNDNNPYEKLPATILDYLDGDFRTFFLSTFKNDKRKAQLILEDIESLVKKKDYYKNI